MTILYHEAFEEAERLIKVTGQKHVVVREDCPCDYDRNCYQCGGEGRYYDVAETCVALVPYDPNFHKFSWSTVADAWHQATMNDLAALRRQTAITLSCVREATEVVRQLTRDLEAA
jgi:hypothetical protein